MGVVIKNAHICDGSGAAWYPGELRIEGGRIASVGRLVTRVEGDEEFDAGGKMLAPGFIDIHNHADWGIMKNPEAANILLQGVTTIIVGQCGLSPAPIVPERVKDLDEYSGISKSGQHVDWNWSSFGEWLSRLDELPLGINVGGFIGQGTVRLCVMGFDSRTPTQEELEKMRSLVEQGMDDGAFGLTSGLAYPPGIYSSDAELEFVAGGLTKRCGLYLSHMRNQSEQSPECVRATINVGRVNNIPVQVVHLKAREGDRPGMAAHLFSIIDEARAEGIDVTVDQYPYTAASSNMRSLMPRWVHAGGVEGIMKLLSDPEKRSALHDEMEASERWIKAMEHGHGPSGIIFGELPFTPEFTGINLEEAARRMNTDPVDALLEIILKNQGCDRGIYFTMSEEDILAVMVNPLVMVGSDGSTADRGEFVHPRYCGTFPRSLGHYARDLKLYPLEEGVRKMTSLPAARLGLTSKGLLRPGMDADLVLFDPETIADGNSYENPTEPPKGIEAVWVGGCLAARGGKTTGKRCGKVLRY
ncbi:MAG: D-aminoacylase [Pyramidobacter sp.]|nr:D-aminoacylase [Pyramidobacter sp.]